MHELYIILITKARRIRIEPCWLDDAFRGIKTSYFEQTIGEILGKVLPIDPQVNPIWRWSRLDLLLQQYRIRKSWQLLTRRYLLLFMMKKIFCLRYFDLFLVEDLQVLIHLVSSNDARISVVCFAVLWDNFLSLKKKNPPIPMYHL